MRETVRGVIPTGEAHRQVHGEAHMDGMTFWLLAGLAAVFVGMSKGGLPMAGTLGVPILALAINPVTAAGQLLPVRHVALAQ